MADIKVNRAPWCPDCKRSKKLLGEHRIPCEWIDIDDDADGLRFVEALQKGGRTVPTIESPGGSYLLEPSDEELAGKLGLEIEADRQAYDLAIIGGGPAGPAAAICSQAGAAGHATDQCWGYCGGDQEWRDHGFGPRRWGVVWTPHWSGSDAQNASIRSQNLHWDSLRQT